MVREESHRAFRAQLVVDEHRQLFDYWVERSRGRAMPERRDINPAHFPKLLPSISLIDIESDSRYRVRLAGSALREIYDREITGLYIDDIDFGRAKDYWAASYARVARTGRPAQGVIRSPRATKEHLVQFWLKLPLAADGSTTPGMILCLDSCVPATSVGTPVSSEVLAAIAG
ncbi:MAG: PAS domain-containing protein [Hyphomicrobiales bacterium]